MFCGELNSILRRRTGDFCLGEPKFFVIMYAKTDKGRLFTDGNVFNLLWTVSVFVY